MSTVSAATARNVRARVVTNLTAAYSVAVNTVERLCDHELGQVERDDNTDQLYVAVADLRLALADLVELIGAGDQANEGGRGVVVSVSRSRFRRHLWSRRA